MHKSQQNNFFMHESQDSQPILTIEIGITRFVIPQE